MIKSFKHKGLQELHMEGTSSRLRQDLAKRVLWRLDALDRAKNLSELRVHGFNFHALHGKPQRYTVHVNGPWCMTFEWIDGDAWRVDLEQYH
jgi:proteic killer suppression protein